MSKRTHTSPSVAGVPTGRAMTRDERVAHRPPRPRTDFAIEDRIIEEIDGVYFVNKPAGWPSTGRTLHDEVCVQYRLMAHARKMVWAVHQLDGDTSGVNVFTRKKSLVPYWHERLRFPSGRKEYLALVHGRVAGACALHARIGRRDDGSWGVCEGGKTAETRVIPVKATAEFSLLRIQLRTGRTHQIRVHLSDAGHPLVGEFWYNDAPCRLAPRHMLHAWRTRFDRRDDIASVSAALPDDFRSCAISLLGGIAPDIDGTPTQRSVVRRHPPGGASDNA